MVKLSISSKISVDGDTMSMITMYTEETVKEITNKLNDPNYYINNKNQMVYSNDNDVIDVVLKHMTGE